MKQSLAELQHSIQAYILSGGQSKQALTVLTQPARLMIYAEMYIARLVGVVQGDFPALAAYWGEEKFKTCAEAYVRAHPSNEYALEHYAHAFPDYVASVDGETSCAYALAQFEWALAEVGTQSHLAWVPRTELAVLDEAAWPSLCLEFQPGLRQLSSVWSVESLWEALSTGQTVPELLELPEAQTTLFWLQDYAAHYQTLEPLAAACLQMALAGKSFAEICEMLAEHLTEEEVAQFALQQLLSWFDRELVVALR